MANQYDRPWSTQPHTRREMAQLKTRQEQVHVLIVCALVQNESWLQYKLIILIYEFKINFTGVNW